jgi:hypothetical protein
MHYYVYLILWILGVLFMSPQMAISAEARDGFVSQQSIQTKHFSIELAGGVSPTQLADKLNILPVYHLLTISSLKENNNDFGHLIDVLFTWVCQTLDMQLYSYKGIIKVVPTRNDLKAILLKLYGREGHSHQSFFVSELNTIYIAAEDFTKEILSHEMGHAIMENFFVVQPPEKAAEVLAGYVEYQLRKLDRP